MNPILPKYVVISESYDSNGRTNFSHCIGVYDDYYKALGHAYHHVHKTAEDITGDRRNVDIWLPQEMEGGVGECIHFSVSEDADSEPNKYCVCIYFNDDAFEKENAQ